MANGWLRLLDNQTGPVLSIHSAPIGSWFGGRCWYSMAKLSVKYQRYFGGKFPYTPSGQGLSHSRRLSERRAVLNALQLTIRDSRFIGVGESVTEAKETAWGKAIASWCLNQICENPKFFLNPAVLSHRLGLEPALQQFPGKFETFIHGWESRFYFSLVIYKVPDEGIVFGSFAARTLEDAVAGAQTETLKNLFMFQRVRDGQEQLLDSISAQRIWNFATDLSSAQRFLKRVKDCTELTLANKTRQAWPRVTVDEVLAPYSHGIKIVKAKINIVESVAPFGVDRWVI